MSGPTHVERSRARFGLARLAVIFGGVNQAVSSLAALIRVPLLIWGLDLEQYGLYMAILGVVSTANLLDFGLQYGVLNAVSDARGRDDHDAVARIVATAFLIYSAIAALVLLLLLPALSLVPMDRLLGVTAEQAPLASKIALLAFAGLMLPMPFKVFSGGLYGFQKQYVVSAFRSLLYVVQLVAISLAVWLRRGDLMLVVVVSVAADLMHWAVLAWVAVRQQPELRLRLRLASRALAPGLTTVGLAFFVTNIANLMKYTLGSTVVSNALGPAAVPSFSVPLALFMTAMGLSGLASQSLWPAFGEAAARGEWAWIDRAFGLGAKAAVGLGGAFAVLGALFGDVLIDVWTPKDVHTPHALLVALGVWVFSQTCFNTASALLSGLNRPTVVMTLAVVEGLAVFLGSVAGVRWIGVEGVGLAMACSGVAAVAAMTTVAVPVFTEGRVRWPWRTVFVVIGCIAVSGSVGYAARVALAGASPIATLLLGAGIAAPVYAGCAWIWLLAPEERARLSAWVGRRLGLLAL